MTSFTDCPTCLGTGRGSFEPCFHCGGTGQVEDDDGYEEIDDDYNEENDLLYW